MDLVEIRSLYKNSQDYFDKEIQIGGWVRSNRDTKSFGFLTL